MMNLNATAAITQDEHYVLAANCLHDEHARRSSARLNWFVVTVLLVVLSSFCMARLTYSALSLFWGEVPSYLVALIIHLAMAVAVGLLFDAAQLPATDSSRGWKSWFGGVVSVLLGLVVVGLAVGRSVTFLEGEATMVLAWTTGLLAGVGEVLADVITGLFAGLAHAAHRLAEQDATWAAAVRSTVWHHVFKATAWQREITRLDKEINETAQALYTAEASMESRNRALQRLSARRDLLVTRDPGQRADDTRPPASASMMLNRSA
ncbi:MAG: hypothetical protein HUU35_06055 [Armatimonadetes bacterium]|nr:hypothetical protein [Armatimonadota bacterium]